MADSENAKEAPKSDEKRTYHVTKNAETGRWQVFLENGTRAIFTFATQKEAIAKAKELSKKNDRSFVIHKTNGAIRKKDYSKK